MEGKADEGERHEMRGWRERQRLGGRGVRRDESKRGETRERESIS